MRIHCPELWRMQAAKLTAILAEGDSSGDMLDSVNKVGANRCAELAKKEIRHFCDLLSAR
jgi:hypothetical protein